MKTLIDSLFGSLASTWDAIPFLSKIKGWRSVIGLVGFLVLAILPKVGVAVPEDVAGYINAGLTIWTGLSLNSKKNPA